MKNNHPLKPYERTMLNKACEKYTVQTVYLHARSAETFVKEVNVQTYSVVEALFKQVADGDITDIRALQVFAQFLREDE